MEPRFALQTFTIRKHLRSPAALRASLARVKALGINAIELARIRFTDEELAVVASMLDGSGPVVECLQLKFDYMDVDPGRTLRMLESLRCPAAAVSVLPGPALTGGRKGMLAFAARLNGLGSMFRQGGKRLLFHHHHFEFLRFDGELGLDLLVRETDPELVGFVVDSYWAQRGGADPASLIRKLASRVGGVHLRDYAVKPALRNFSPDLLSVDAAVGEGNLDIPSIVEACRATGVRYLAIEQDTRAPFGSLATSVRNLKALGYGALF